MEISSSGHEEISSLWNISGLVHLRNADYHIKTISTCPSTSSKKKESKK